MTVCAVCSVHLCARSALAVYVPWLDAKAQAVKQALKREAMRRRADDAPEDIVMGAEADLVGAFVDLVRFELQSGHAEVAVARIQGSLELNFFSPLDLKGTHALQVVMTKL